MNEWLTATAGLAVLVTVARVEGSSPRATGTKMLVTAGAQLDTVGGGHLELRAAEIAREMIAAGDVAVRYERFPLGPSLGQCCGGVVWLTLEPVRADLAGVLQALRGRRRADSWRVTAIDGEPACALFDDAGALIAGSAIAPVGNGTARLIADASGRRWLVDPVLAPRANVLLFGAGHVGAAIVRALAELPCSVTWVDERDDMFPAVIPANVTVEVTDTPETLVALAPPNATYLVMTHSHALDQRLCEAILARERVGWFGLIGSKTKRAQFESRMAARGIAPERIATMVCPIGLPGIDDKAPPVIAASVAAQLLILWQAQAALDPQEN
ncbi:xanthine dehydrogenase accessory protein XdhC [Pseudoduganella plicata]|uniref:Xanthine dehydrogenase accessory protein XdhC n=1 Tax=Pseudoduganella plicata TaxID=321984 RepID=A0A4P7BHY4_9BURK|nr:xanthine dehydrogenase accessory protein XdhC [Pseudoduganella plicata]QBQ38434.1 xanthine dehydrogenase accessory protein XdhC [Pseudoduganella plicata]GGY82063.1 xanthine dehydrogenase accessory protein XdhC [Pseudoduganella plicata]